MYLPCKGLAEIGHQVYYDAGNMEVDAADYLIFQRLAFKEDTIDRCLRDMSDWKKAGKKIIIDYDDNFFEMDETNPAYQDYGEDAIERMKRVIGYADAITVTAEPLVEHFLKFHENVHVLPNYIDQSALTQPRDPSDHLIIGWQGGPTHQGDLRLIKSVVNELQAKKSFEFVLAGYSPNGFFKKRTFRQWQVFNPDLSHFNLFRDFDIGLCPLTKSSFNECRTDIKFVEYSSMGIPTIASDISTYGTIKHGKTGYLARNQSDWRKYLVELIDDKDKRVELGKNAKEYVTSKRTIQHNIWRWEDLLSGL